jgi:hypothetical protein
LPVVSNAPVAKEIVVDAISAPATSQSRTMKENANLLIPGR